MRLIIAAAADLNAFFVEGVGPGECSAQDTLLSHYTLHPAQPIHEVTNVLIMILPNISHKFTLTLNASCSHKLSNQGCRLADQNRQWIIGIETRFSAMPRWNKIWLFFNQKVIYENYWFLVATTVVFGSVNANSRMDKVDSKLCKFGLLVI